MRNLLSLARLSLASACLLLLLGGSHARGAIPTFECHSDDPELQNRLSVLEGLQWTQYADRIYTEPQAREDLMRDCRLKYPFRSRLTGHCEKIAREARCHPVSAHTCTSMASIYSRTNELGIMPLRLGAVYVPSSSGEEERTLLGEWFPRFCPIALERRLFGIQPRMAGPNFCDEIAANLRCN